MVKTATRNAEELSLRQNAAQGNFKKVQEILNRNKTILDFNVNSQSSNGNTALHWACYYASAKPDQQDHSEKYSEIIRLLVENGADHQIKNKSGKIAHDFLQELHFKLSESPLQIQKKDSCYFTLISTLLRCQCSKITTPEELPGELRAEVTFYYIIDSLKLFNFFPSIICVFILLKIHSSYHPDVQSYHIASCSSKYPNLQTRSTNASHHNS